jgi:hypothetical protein
MTRSRRRPRVRASDVAARQRSSLQQLGFAVVALVMLLLVWNHLAEGAAGCFTTLSGPVADPGARHDAPAKPEAPDAAPAPAPEGMIRLGQPPPNRSK